MRAIDPFMVNPEASRVETKRVPTQRSAAPIDETMARFEVGDRRWTAARGGLGKVRGLGELGLSLVAIAWVAGCAHAKIPNTNIDDTEANRQILEVVGAYHRAIESVDADAVLTLVSRAYFEDSGTTDPSDDVDYAGLERSLKADFAKTQAMKLEVRVDAVGVKGDEAFAEIFYQFNAHAEYPSGTKWDSGSDRTRLRFRRDGDRWLIVGGL